MYTDKFKLQAIIYGIISALTFSYLVLADNAGISVVIFTIVQAILLYWVVPDKKKLWMYIPIGVISLNFFLSGSDVFRVSNFVVCLALYSMMFVKLDIKDIGLSFIGELFDRIFQPLGKIPYSFEWIGDLSCGKGKKVQRILLALGLSCVTVVVLSLVLSGADMVFGKGVEEILSKITDIFSVNTVMKIAAGVVVGLYLFGVVVTGCEEYDRNTQNKQIRGDLIIIGTVLMSVLLVYTVFVFIQFKYLFAGGELPYGLNVTEYARKGFFELLALSVVNIGAILSVTSVTRHLEGKKLVFIKVLNSYLCAVTMVLLASSFYRMWLYNAADGLTRLRFMVFGFLIFEAIGLLVTFIYIIKPKFNVVLIYFGIALFYYMLLNVMCVDRFVAKSQADRFLLGERSEVFYLLTLSSDAASEVERVYKNTDNEKVREQCENWFKENINEYKETSGWQKYNLSYENCYMAKD